jgi:hypothetical protein
MMRKIVVIILFGIFALPKGNAQQVFYSQSLQNIYWSLPDDCRDMACRVSTMNIVVLCHDMVQGDAVPLIYRWDENRVLEHIGYRFLQSDSITINDVIVRFIERELLAMLLSNDINQTLISYRENGLSVLLNDKPIKQSVLQNKQSLLDLLKNNQGIAINYEGKKYEVSLFLDKKQKLSFYFPADSELLTGMDKKERDVRLAIQLKNHCTAQGKVNSPDYSYLKLLRDTVYVNKGSSFMIPQINNDLYYVKADSTYSLAFDKSLIAESFANALLVPAGNNYTINITHRMYGGVVKNYTVNSRDFDDYFLHGYDRYFGIESLDKDVLTGTLILSDRNAGSIHLAFVSVKKEDLLTGGTMEIQLYSNIPQHNIKTLFGK